MSLHVFTKCSDTVFTRKIPKDRQTTITCNSMVLRPLKALQDAADHGDDEGEGGDRDDGADDEGHDGSDPGEGDDGHEADGDEIGDQDDASEEAGSDAFDDDQTTLVLGATPPGQSLSSESSEDEPMEKCIGEAVGGRDPDLSSTDNESRSPWEVTGQSQKRKALRKRMELEGKAWPPSPTTYAAGMASESDDDDVPNVPASSGGDTGSGLNLHALVVPPIPPTPSSDGSSDNDDGDERVNHEVNRDYITPPKRATTMPQWSSMKSMKMNDGKVKVEPNLSRDDAAASWLATGVAVVWMVMVLLLLLFCSCCCS